MVRVRAKKLSPSKKRNYFSFLISSLSFPLPRFSFYTRFLSKILNVEVKEKKKKKVMRKHKSSGNIFFYHLSSFLIYNLYSDGIVIYIFVPRSLAPVRWLKFTFQIRVIGVYIYAIKEEKRYRETNCGFNFCLQY